MKVVLSIAALAIVFASCQKNLSEKESSLSATVSSDALQPLPCHSTSFVTEHAALPGKVPPFKYVKTLYSDTRIKTINMLSRANPIYSTFKPQAWELTGTFTYAKNTAYFNGTKQLWEYYKTPTGAAAKKSIVKKNVSLKFDFYNAEMGTEEAQEAGTCYAVTNLLENKNALRTFLYPHIKVGEGSDEPVLDFQVNYISGDLLTIEAAAQDNITPLAYKDRMKLTFNYKQGSWNEPIRQSYQPTQNWISLEYTLLEVMQWLPSGYKPFQERTSVSVEFYPYNTAHKVVQSQVYKNHQYDAKRNLLSYTYGDNVKQKTTWYCK